MQLVQRRGWKTDIWKSAKRSLREGQRRAKLHLLEEIFDLFKKIPERVLNLWKSSSLCSSWHWPAHLVENSPRGLASPRLYGEDNFCNSCGQQQERTSFQCGGKLGDLKAKSVGSWKSRELCHCKDKPLAVERDGSKNIARGTTDPEYWLHILNKSLS